ncbi:MAG: GyrI-like domain-containing protein [Chloroflexota bacterium]
MLIIEMEGMMSNYAVVLKTTEPVLVASRRITITENNEYPVGLPEAFKETHKYVQKHGKQAGPAIAVWHTPVDATVEDVEATFPIETPIVESERIKVHELPGEQVASVLFKGKMDHFMQGVDAVLKWIEANHYTKNGPFREVYHDFTNMDNVAIEIQFPVEKL